MELDEKMRLLDQVDELGLHRKVAKLRARTVRQEWEMLSRIVAAELDRIADGPPGEDP